MSRKVNLGKIIPQKGVDYFDGKDGKDGADGQDGITPHIGENGNWWIGDTDTGAKVEGTGGGDSTPVGNIISFMGTIAPDGYLTCDGAVLNIADYSRLASHFETQFGSKNYFGGDGETTFAVPDLRNEFLRGYGGGADTQLSGEIGIHQDATEIPNIYMGNYGKTLYSINYDFSGANPGNAPDKIDENKIMSSYGTDTSKYQYAMVTSTVSSNANFGDRTVKYTSRPTNVAVLYCIKY